ncbi:MAG TPA: mechanosensitive ion channel family protein [Dehalococcoidia bacterium]|nr:mechanosensitive ion channel family protein [Dehalococcoidia bacterium]
MFDWLNQNWLSISVPLLVFLAAYVVGLWARRIAYKAFNRWAARGRWEGSHLVVQTTRTPFLHWFLILGTYIAIHVSVLDPSGKILADKVLATLFIISLTWVAASLSEKLLRLYVGKVERLQPSSALIVNIARIAIAVVGVLILLDVWGAPTTPIILLLAVGILVAALAFRDVIPNFFSGFQLVQGEQVRVGDFIKLESGEEGYITDVTWRNTQIRGLDGNLILVPNSRLVQTTVINYGRPLKKATEPFRFYARLHLKELTGLKAGNLTQLVDILKEAPDSVIYYHTHHFLEEHQYLTPEPANDFALWVSDELGDEVLGEKLASIDTFDFPTIGALRTRIVGVIEDHLSKKPDGRKAMEGRELHFVRSISAILPTPYVAHDLREFVEVLRKVSIDSLYYHIFEARLRLQKGVNDFSIWIEDCLGDKDLADKLAYLDPYNYTLESLRSTIIQLVEKRIK